MTKARDLANGGFGLVLMKPSSVVNGTDNGKGTITIGSTVSFVSLNNVFNSTYNSYRIIFDCSTTTAFSASQGDMHFRFRVSGSDASSGNNYNYQGWGATTSVSAGYDTTTFQFIGKFLAATPTRYATTIDVHGVALAQETKYQILNVGMNGGTNQSYGLNGWHGVATAYDGITFYPSTGTMSGGTISVYGYNK
jgi:hypothetical protein